MNPNPENEESYSLDVYNVKKASLILRAINHDLRQIIIKVICQNKKISVTELYSKLRIEQSVASQHLALLRRAEIVSTIREGKFIYYSLNFIRINEIEKFVGNLLR